MLDARGHEAVERVPSIGEQRAQPQPREVGFEALDDRLAHTLVQLSVFADRFTVDDAIAVLDASTVEISELPVKVWTQSYKENVLEPMLNNEKGPQLIT